MQADFRHFAVLQSSVVPADAAPYCSTSRPYNVAGVYVPLKTCLQVAEWENYSLSLEPMKDMSKNYSETQLQQNDNSSPLPVLPISLQIEIQSYEIL